MNNVKKVTQRDRYGNQISYEFESPQKPLDITKLIEKQMEAMPVPPMQTPQMTSITYGNSATHPGSPRGQDTVPAWLTPGEFVVNKEAMQDPQNAATVEAINDEGRMMQANMGGMVPPMPMDDAQYYWWGGDVWKKFFNKKPEDQLAPGVVKPSTPSGGTVGEAYDLGAIGGMGGIELMGGSPSELGRMMAEQQAEAEDDFAPYGWNVEQHRPNTYEEGIEQGLVTPDIPVYEADAISPMEQNILDEEAAAAVPAPLEDPYAEPVEALGQQEETGVDWNERARESLKTGRGILGGLYEPTEAEVLAEADRLRRAAAQETRTVEETQKLYDEQDFETRLSEIDLTETEEYNQLKTQQETAAAELESVKENEALVNQAKEEIGEQEKAIETTDRLKDLEQALAETDDPDRKAEIQAEIDKINETGEASPKKGDVSKNKITNAESLVDRLNLVQQEEAATGSDNNSPAGDPAANEEAKTAGENTDNKTKSEAFGMLKGLFGDLLDTKELRRMAVLYAGSRLLGYSHGGSLQWAAEGYLTRVDAKAANRDEFIKDNADTYTPESLQAYKESGNLSDLKQKGVTLTPLGEFKTVFDNNGRKVRVQKMKGSDDSVVWRSDDGRNMTNQWSDDASLIQGTPEYTKRVGDESQVYQPVLKEILDRPEYNTGVGADGQAKESIFKFGSEGASQQAARWQIANAKNVPPELMESVMTQAVADAAKFREDEIARGNSGRIEDLTPFFNQAWTKSEAGNPELFRDKEDKPISIAKLTPMFDDFRFVARRLNPGVYEGKSDAEINKEFVVAAREAWAQLGPEGQKSFNDAAADDESGFVVFMNSEMQKLYKDLNNRSQQ